MLVPPGFQSERSAFENETQSKQSSFDKVRSMESALARRLLWR
jgi:hypothetical protein